MARRRNRLPAVRKPLSVGLVSLCALICALLVFGAPALATGEAPPPEPKPASTSAPTLMGTPVVGQTLSCSQGGWANNPASYTYAWFRDGNPIPGQTGTTYTVQVADWGHSISCQVTASNSGGEYTIVGLVGDSYNVEFRADSETGNYQPQFYSANPVSVLPPNTTSGINAAMSAGGQITGKATRASDGSAFANVEVCANNTSSGGCASTNASGEYTILGLSTGSYTVEFNPLFERPYYGLRNYLRQFDKGVSVTAGSTTTGIDGALPTGGQITGRVTKSGGTGLANIKVCALNGEGECGTTNANGEYTISGLPTGSYDVEFSPGDEDLNYLPQYYNGKSSTFEDEAVSVIAGGSPTSGVNAEMHPGGQITGKVTAASGGAVLGNIEVCAEGRTVVLRACTTTSANGEYSISSIPSGSYGVHFLPGHERANYQEGGNYLPQYYNDKSSYSEAEAVSVLAGGAPTSGVNAELASGGRITGTVTVFSGAAPLANVEVCIGEPLFVERLSCPITNANGEYTILGLTSGSYDVHFYPYEDGNYLPEVDNGVSVAVGATTSGIDAAVLPGGQITGRVSAASGGAGLANIEVCAESTSGGRYSCATTNGGGGSAGATSNALVVPAPDSSFSMAKAPVFDAKTGDLEFFFKVSTPGTFRWGLSFKNADVGFADSLGLSLNDSGFVAEAARKKSKKCNASYVKHKGKCVRTLVPFGSGSKSVPAGTVELEVHASAKALKALKAGHALHVSGPFTFQSAVGGMPVTHTESTVVRWPKHKKHSKKRR